MVPFQVINWAKSLNVTREKRGSKEFNGENVVKLMNNADSLIAALPADLKQFGRTLKKFNAVRLSCFGKTLDADYQKKMDAFEASFKRLQGDINQFPKFHVIIKHVPEFCARYGPLGPYSEQTFESVHYEFAKTWGRYSRPIGTSDYATQLLKAVVDFNTLRI